MGGSLFARGGALALAALLLALSASPARSQGALPDDPAAMLAAMTTPRVTLVRVYVADLDRAERFYREVFGLQPAAPSAAGRVLAFPDPNAARIVLARAPTPREHGDFSDFGIAVSDMDEVLQRTEAAGGRIATPARAIGNGLRVAFIRDPDGANIELIGPVNAAN